MSLVGAVARHWQPSCPRLGDAPALRLELRDREAADRAAALLGPPSPSAPTPTILRFAVARDGSATGPDGVTRLLARIDDAGSAAR